MNSSAGARDNRHHENEWSRGVLPVNINVVVAEDEHQVREGISEYIRELGLPYNLVASASNGVEALRIISEQPTDVLLTDIRMPQMDGLELIEKVSESFPEMKIIIVSGYDDFEYARKALKYGVKDYILKPLNKDTLVQTLNTITRMFFQDIDKYKEVMISKEKWDMELSGMESELYGLVEIGDAKQAVQLAPCFLDALRTKVNDDNKRLITLLIDTLITLRKRLSGIDYAEAYTENRWKQVIDRLSPSNSVEELIEETLHFILFCCTAIMDCRIKACPDVIQRCKWIIETQYSRDLSLVYVSDLLGVSPAYLSRTFKKDLGWNFVDYLNHIRLNKAKELLSLPNIRVKDAAVLSGYQNTYYFNRVFKRDTGYTPQEYRTMHGVQI